MMFDLQDALKQLSKRLPELEWQLSSLGNYINPKQLPRGLFREQLEYTPQSCALDVKHDLHILKSQTNRASAHFLAERIHQKINVLVRLCQTKIKVRVDAPLTTWGLRAISTRQQWLKTLEADVLRLSEQQTAMQTLIASMQAEYNAKALLVAQGALGDIERQLTMAREVLARATRL
jgi:hypothetical protein